MLIVINEATIHYKINYDNTNEENFLHFMEELYEILDKKMEQKKYAFLMDNLSLHRTQNLIYFYELKK